VSRSWHWPYRTVSYSGGDGLTRGVGETMPRYDSQMGSEGRHGGDSFGRGSGSAQPSSEEETRPRGRPALERGGVSVVRHRAPRARRSFARGVSGPTSWRVTEVARAVDSCHQAVMAWGVIYNLWVRLCFYYFAKKWVFPRLSGDPYGCPRHHLMLIYFYMHLSCFSS
jgi:hypothetical protein